MSLFILWSIVQICLKPTDEPFPHHFWFSFRVDLCLVTMNTNKRILNILELGRHRKKRRLDLQRASYANRVNFGRRVASAFIHESIENVTKIQSNQLIKNGAAFTTPSESHISSTTGIHNEYDVHGLHQQRNVYLSSSEDSDRIETTSSDDTSHSSELIDEEFDYNQPDSNGRSNHLDKVLLALAHHCFHQQLIYSELDEL